MVFLSRSSIPPKHHHLVPLEMAKLVMPQNCLHVHDEVPLLPILVLLIVPPSRLRLGPSMVHVTVRMGRESTVVHLIEWCVLSLLMKACFLDAVMLPETFMVRLSSNPFFSKNCHISLKRKFAIHPLHKIQHNQNSSSLNMVLILSIYTLNVLFSSGPQNFGNSSFRKRNDIFLTDWFSTFQKAQPLL